MTFSPDSSYLLSTAYNDRFPTLWDCNDVPTEENIDAGATDTGNGAAQTLTMDAPPACCDIVAKDTGADQVYDILAVSEWSFEFLALGQFRACRKNQEDE